MIVKDLRDDGKKIFFISAEIAYEDQAALLGGYS